MRLLDIEAAIGTAILLLSLPCDAKHSHRLHHLEAMGKRHDHERLHASPRAEGVSEVLEKRGSCEFPSDAGLVAVTPGSSNGGWAMSPNQPCTPGSYCPFACPPGQVMAQWSPQATSYTYPESMDGGCYCDETGQVTKPFPNNDYCVSGTGTVSAENECSEGVAFCQTVLPGNEAMLIPTEVAAGSTATLAIPGPSYWLSTASHFYVNPPGYSTDDACIWSDGSKPIGNWSPYVVGGNTDSNGNTFFKIAWNPEWTGSSSLSSTPPTFGLKVECASSGCNGLPCSINPSTDGIGGVTSSDQASGAGGANFCVVTVPEGNSATVVVFSTDSSSDSDSSSSSDSSSEAASSSAYATPTPTPTPNPTPTPSSTSTSTPTSSSPSSTSSADSSSSISSSSSSSSSPSSSSSTKGSHTVSLLTSSTVNITSSSATPENSPHVLFQESNSTSTGTGSSMASATGGSGATAVETSPIASAIKKSSASETLISSTLISLGALSAIFVTFL